MVIRSCLSQKNRQQNCQKRKVKRTNKVWSTKHYTDNYRLSTVNPTNNWVWTQVLQNGKQLIVTGSQKRQVCFGQCQVLDYLIYEIFEIEVKHRQVNIYSNTLLRIILSWFFWQSLCVHSKMHKSDFIFIFYFVVMSTISCVFYSFNAQH